MSDPISNSRESEKGIHLIIKLLPYTMDHKDATEESLTPSSSSGIFEIGTYDDSRDFIFNIHAEPPDHARDQSKNDDPILDFEEQAQSRGIYPNDEGIDVSSESRGGNVFRCPVCQVMCCENQEALNDHLDVCLNREILEEMSSQQSPDELSDADLNATNSISSMPTSSQSQNHGSVKRKYDTEPNRQLLVSETSHSGKRRPSNKRKRTRSQSRSKQTTLDDWYYGN